MENYKIKIIVTEGAGFFKPKEHVKNMNVQTSFNGDHIANVVERQITTLIRDLESKK